MHRYQRPCWTLYFPDYERYDRFLTVELAALKAYVKLGKVPEEDYEKSAGRRCDVKDIERIEKDTHHDVIAFTRSVTRNLGKEKKWFHYGLTPDRYRGYGLGLAFKSANQGLEAGLVKILGTLKRHAPDV